MEEKPRTRKPLKRALQAVFGIAVLCGVLYLVYLWNRPQEPFFEPGSLHATRIDVQSESVLYRIQDPWKVDALCGELDAMHYYEYYLDRGTGGSGRLELFDGETSLLGAGFFYDGGEDHLYLYIRVDDPEPGHEGEQIKVRVDPSSVPGWMRCYREGLNRSLQNRLDLGAADPYSPENPEVVPVP